MNNAMWTAKNPHQGSAKRVLCVCSAGLLRSPTAAWVLSNDPFNFNTRSAGVEDSYALIPVTETLLYWADHIVCMTNQHRDMLLTKLEEFNMLDKPITVLHVPDNYGYKDKTLVRIINEKCAEHFNVK